MTLQSRHDSYPMSDQVECAVHGERQRAFVCGHLLGDAAGLGFNRDLPTENKPFPDAWCDNCELIRVAHNGWTDESERLTSISLLCCACYERSRIRNTHTSTTLDDMATLRWKCGSCEEWHMGPCLDFSYDSPHYWSEEHAKLNDVASLAESDTGRRATFLNEDYCAIEDRDFFVRGVIHLPNIGTAETFRWGVWGSLSRENFETMLKMDDEPERVDLPPMFSWLSSQIPEYPDTLSLKMYSRIQRVDWRPEFEMELTDHPLSREFHHGITPERVKEIMLRRLPAESE